MTEKLPEPILPNVTKDDLTELWLEEITDAKNIQRWFDFALANPILSTEIHARAGEALRKARSDHERVKAAIDLVTYAVRALEVARRREISGDAADGANQQP